MVVGKRQTMQHALIEEGLELHCKIDALPAQAAETVVV